jgi:hypothetical protein
MTKIVEMSSPPSSMFPNPLSLLFPLNLIIGLIFPWTLFTSAFGIAMDDPLKNILGKLNEEENKKCLEAMAFHILGDKIQASLGDGVEVQFIQQ